jgi:hypothetical protein
MKKGIIFLLLLSAIFLGGCKKEVVQNMDELSADNKFHYKNQDLGFSLTLQTEFQKYQTQRNKTDEYDEIEFFVPTADVAYPQEVPGYAKAVVVRVYTDAQWSKYDKKTFVSDTFKSLGSGNGKVFFIKFWKARPADMQGVWSDQKEAEIVSSFIITK